MSFATPLTVTGPTRRPRQMLAEQTYGGHASLHDDATAGSLGLSGAPIEGPTHFSQFDPLAFDRWGQQWFVTGCISAHFKTMVVEGEEVTASLACPGPRSGPGSGPAAVLQGSSTDPGSENPGRTDAAAEPLRIGAVKADGSPVLEGTVSIKPSAESELDARLGRTGDPGDLFILDQMTIGQRTEPVTAAIDRDSTNGPGYPFSLAQKLDAITEPSPWYDSADNPWKRPILPFEMISVLTQKTGAADFAVRGPSIGLFLDLEVRLLAGPLFIDQDYVLEREVVGLSQSRRTESSWVRTSVTDASSGDQVATVLLHSGVFKDSYAHYPTGRLPT